MNISIKSIGSKCQNYAPARGPQNQPKATPEVKVRESASHHLFKKHRFLRQNVVFLVLECSHVDLESFPKKRQIMKLEKTGYCVFFLGVEGGSAKTFFR